MEDQDLGELVYGECGPAFANGPPLQESGEMLMRNMNSAIPSEEKSICACSCPHMSAAV